MRVADATGRRAATIAESMGQVLAQIAEVRADIERQSARALQVRRRLDADIVEGGVTTSLAGSPADQARHAIAANEQLEAVTGVDMAQLARSVAARLESASPAPLPVAPPPLGSGAQRS